MEHNVCKEMKFQWIRNDKAFCISHRMLFCACSFSLFSDKIVDSFIAGSVCLAFHGEWKNIRIGIEKVFLLKGDWFGKKRE
jgi:hypothetical protein